MANQDDWLVFAKNLALEAGAMIVDARERMDFVRDYKVNHELVTSIDVEVDQFITSEIQARYPAHSILSEELSPSLDWEQVKDAPVWVIDPIDGTVNFAHGHFHVAVSIGVFVGGERMLGVVNAPFLNECFTAMKGKGAFCNEVPLSVGSNSNLRNALVATGFPYRKDGLDAILKRISKVLHCCQDIRRNGSAALDLCWVASGRLDAYFESVKPWDMAAGTLIAEEAGARVGHYSEVSKKWPEVVNGDALLVSVPSLFDDFLSLLVEG